jgi:hypothetical protein
VTARGAAGCGFPGVELFLLEWLLATLNAAEADTVAVLHRLNAEAVRAFARSDASWCDEHLSDDFICTLADGRRLDRARFLGLSAQLRPVEHVTCDEVDVRPLGELQLGLVHGVVHAGSGESCASTRFTNVWLVRGDRWQLVAAHLTRIALRSSSGIV